MKTSQERAREIVMKLSHCNAESFDHPKHKASLEWQSEIIATALDEAQVEGRRTGIMEILQLAYESQDGLLDSEIICHALRSAGGKPPNER